MQREVRRAIEQVGLPAAPVFFGDTRARSVSARRKRVLIAMAVLHYPALLIADEPTSSLDISLSLKCSACSPR